jgi:hypothetical protein
VILRALGRQPQPVAVHALVGNHAADRAFPSREKQKPYSPLMPSANLELVRSIFAAWEVGDFSSIDWAHPEIELVFGDGPDPGSWVGLPAVAERWREQLSTWYDYRVAAGEIHDGERVIVLSSFSARGRASGLDLERIGRRWASMAEPTGLFGRWRHPLVALVFRSYLVPTWSQTLLLKLAESKW